MNKFQIINALKRNGDSVITLFSELDGMLVTTDFRERYIKRQNTRRQSIQKDCILLFSWTHNCMKQIEVKKIKHIQPLAAILQNTPPETLTNGTSALTTK